MFERDGEQLVRPARLIVRAVQLPALDHVEEVLTVFIPEALVEGAAATFGVPVQLLGLRRLTDRARPACHEPECVVPERVDLDGLAAPRRDDPAVALRVHPRQLVALLALREQAVRGVYLDAEARA